MNLFLWLQGPSGGFFPETIEPSHGYTLPNFRHSASRPQRSPLPSDAFHILEPRGLHPRARSKRTGSFFSFLHEACSGPQAICTCVSDARTHYQKFLSCRDSFLYQWKKWCFKNSDNIKQLQINGWRQRFTPVVSQRLSHPQPSKGGRFAFLVPQRGREGQDALKANVVRAARRSQATIPVLPQQPTWIIFTLTWWITSWITSLIVCAHHLGILLVECGLIGNPSPPYSIVMTILNKKQEREKTLPHTCCLR